MLAEERKEGVCPCYYYRMEFAPVYLIQRLWFRIYSFFKHWYGDGSRAIWGRFLLTLATADRSFAVKVTLRHFFEPLYKDYSGVGRVVGIIFRSGRIIIGGVVYLFIALFFALIYGTWLAIPVLVLWYVAAGTM